MKKCYRCGKEQSSEQVLEVNLFMDEVNALLGLDGPEGDIHCSGPDEMFIQPEDAKKLSEMYKLDLSNWEYGVVYCMECWMGILEEEGDPKIQKRWEELEDEIMKRRGYE